MKTLLCQSPTLIALLLTLTVAEVAELDRVGRGDSRDGYG